MQLCVLTLLYSSFLASLSEASPRGGGLFVRDGGRSDSSFLAGVGVNIDAVKNVGGTTTALPAISNVSAEWNVPFVDVKNGRNRTLYQFTGIQGNDCVDDGMRPAFLAGTAVRRSVDNDTIAWAWYQWYPGPVHSQYLEVNPGDQIHVAVSVKTPNSGYMYLKNMRTGIVFDSDMDPDDPEDTTAHICLGQGTAGFAQKWVIQAKYDTQIVPIFQNVTFSNIMALDRGGKSYDLSAGDVDYWSLVNEGKQVEIPEQIDGKSFVIYSPEGEAWDPSAWNSTASI
ncbi:hypothetical protein M434DRAFT_39110 [Hypoxylon sp. CO27-5]|nr:hypothetical protein M434DRAFT_39110 [Hypoxylon sp. CO27-5]